MVVTTGFPCGFQGKFQFPHQVFKFLGKLPFSHWISTLSPNKPHLQAWDQWSLYQGVLLYSPCGTIHIFFMPNSNSHLYSPKSYPSKAVFLKHH